MSMASRDCERLRRFLSGHGPVGARTSAVVLLIPGAGPNDRTEFTDAGVELDLLALREFTHACSVCRRHCHFQADRNSRNLAQLRWWRHRCKCPRGSHEQLDKLAGIEKSDLVSRKLGQK